MRVTSSKELPPPPPRMPVTFHLELTEDEALVLCDTVGSIGGEYGPFRHITDDIYDQLINELARQEVIPAPGPSNGWYPVSAILKTREIYPSSQLTISVGRFDK